MGVLPPPAVLQVPSLGQDKDMKRVQESFEAVQMELLFQNRRLEDTHERVAKLETAVDKIAKIAVENEGLHLQERKDCVSWLEFYDSAVFGQTRPRLGKSAIEEDKR